MSDAGEVVGFVVEAAGEVLGVLVDVSLDSDTKPKTRRGVIITLLIVAVIVIGTVVLLVYG